MAHGTIFFSNCNMNCIYCQNYEISEQGRGKEITIEELADIFMIQQEKNAQNVNLVTPTSYALQIIEAIKIAKRNGFKIPIIYNTNGYEKVETLKLLDGLVDIYLPDFKYADNNLAKRLSLIDNYYEVAKDAIKEMYRQVGSPKLNKYGIIEKGLIIRHLILPNHIDNTKKVLSWINENIDKDVYVSIMSQYFPSYKAKEIEDINRKINYEEYKEVEDYLFSLDIENGYMQDYIEDENEEKYVPDFKK